ncbi:MAG TPA: sensor histidine kinase [Sphingomicrobium sp.]|jgi:two-component sensor histidine kinase|nr:sensor histidine kinase [Sphingomicrobium sp.]
MTLTDRFARQSTAAKLLLILTAVLLPIGIALAWVGNNGIRQANLALQGRNQDQSRAASQAIESLIARNALGLRVAAAGALANPIGDVCAQTAAALATAPAITREFSLRDTNGNLLCTYGGFIAKETTPLVAPGNIHIWLNPAERQVDVRVGVVGGMATASIPIWELRSAVAGSAAPLELLEVRDGENAVTMIGSESQARELAVTDWPIGDGNLVVRVGVAHRRITTSDRLLLLLPLLMWIAAAIITWSLVSTLLVRPLKRLGNAVLAYRPGEGPQELPRQLGPSEEIRELRNSFARTIDRIEQSERETSSALEGQRRLVREVHHRVKNNLQVVASLLNIHGRNAESADARAAYAGISRRVGALSVVHRNHFADMEENRGIALRPLVTELAAELRASAPENARRLAIDLEMDSVNTTQDVAVAVSFLVTEIVEYAMLHAPTDPVELSIRRTSELTARLSLGSPVLVPEEDGNREKQQFERIVGGLAKQLRSVLDRKLGRYSVDLPVFPAT